MKTIFSVLLMSFMFVVVSIQSSAAKVFFGETKSVIEIQDVSATGPSGEDLFLGYKITKHFFLGGLYLKDDGYVLGVRGRNAYIRLTPADIQRRQSLGELPTPLPAYRIDILQYAIGYSLWLFIAGVIGWTVIGNWYNSITAERRLKKLQSLFPKIVSCAIVANGVATQDRIALTDNWHSRLFAEPLDQAALHAALAKAEDSGPHLMNLFGSICRSIPSSHRETVLIVFSDILLSAGYGARERSVLAEAGKRLKFKKKDIQELIQTFDARHQKAVAV